MSFKVLSQLFALFAFVTGLAAPPSAHADDVAAFRVKFVATFGELRYVSLTPPVAFVEDQIAGNGTHLGSFTGRYPHLVNLEALTFEGSPPPGSPPPDPGASFTAPNGDILYIKLSGSGEPTGPTTFNVNYVGEINSGTGRFVGASGKVSGPGTVDLATRTVKARLVGTINKPDLPYTGF